MKIQTDNPKPKFPIWKTITIGDKPNLTGINVYGHTDITDILNKIIWGKKETIKLVKIQVRDLGCKKEFPTISQIYAKAKKLGLSLCPPQVGPQLRVEYMDQSIDGWVYIGMKPITDRNGIPYMVVLGGGGGCIWLDVCWAIPDNAWDPEVKFVFSLRYPK